MAKKRPQIRYTSRDFDSIKQDLENYARRYYPDTYKDFSEAGFGSLMLDATSYIGDILSFYLDYQTNESFIDSAIEPNNILRHGRSRGYKFSSHPSSFGIVAFYVIVPANINGIGPNTDYMPILRRGSELATAGGNGFILNEDVDFGKEGNEVVVAKVDNDTGVPLSYVVKAYGQVISGEIRQQTFNVDNYKRFLKLRINNDNVAEVLRVVDSESHEYFEVDYLSQDVIYKEVINRDLLTKDNAPVIMKPVPVPRRFVVEQLKNATFLQFGYGTPDNIDANSLTDPSTVVLKVHGKDYVSDPSFDPSQLIESDKFGIVPVNTTLTAIYRVNSTSNVNAPVGALNTVVRPIFDFKDYSLVSRALTNNVVSSLELENESPILGDISFPSSEELKRRIVDISAMQNRAVTRQDYIAASYALPAKFGSIKRANIVQDSDSFKRNLNMYVISENSSGKLTPANNIIKQNLKTWLNKYKMINDTLDIIDAKIVNIGINFVAVGEKNIPSYILLQRAMDALIEKFEVHFDIGEPFFISDVYSTINRVEGIVDTTFVEIIKKVGSAYSDAKFDIRKMTSADGRLIEVPENVVLEIKYPNIDFKGEIR